LRRAPTLLALFALACQPRAGAPPPTARPSPASGTGWSVVLITIDTLRADHLGLYGYRRATSPRLDAFAKQAAVFDAAYTYWPKTRASFIMMMTGRRPSQNGYSKTHAVLLDFNATLASVLKSAGYTTAAYVDNANVAAQHGYSKGFDSYMEAWQRPELKSEMDRTFAITEGGLATIRNAPADKPFFLWLHYVNPHAPYTPPAPYDKKFLDQDSRGGADLRVVKGYKAGVHEQLAVTGQGKLGYYVAQYDGEIAAVDEHVGRVLDALAEQGRLARTVVAVTSDHGESLGEHDYYFDHGENLFEPSLRIPLLLAAPGVKPQRSDALASTLDLLPTLLDAVKVSYPPELAGRSLLPGLIGGKAQPPERLFAQNDYNLRASFDERLKLVATPVGDKDQWGLYDRQRDPGETRNVRQQRLDDFRVERRELDLYFELMEREWVATRRLVIGKPGEGKMTPEACEQLKALGYAGAGCS
jgi:arylsulfatase A-like enzyme